VTFDCDTPFEAIIEGVVGVGHLGDIAIDDISFTPECNLGSLTPPPMTTPMSVSTVTPSPTTHTCAANQFQCTSGQCIDMAKRYDPVLSLSLLGIFYFSSG
jgi:hypothetical protein